MNSKTFLLPDGNNLAIHGAAVSNIPSTWDKTTAHASEQEGKYWIFQAEKWLLVDEDDLRLCCCQKYTVQLPYYLNIRCLDQATFCTGGAQAWSVKWTNVRGALDDTTVFIGEAGFFYSKDIECSCAYLKTEERFSTTGCSGSACLTNEWSGNITSYYVAILRDSSNGRWTLSFYPNVGTERQEYYFLYTSNETDPRGTYTDAFGETIEVVDYVA